MRKLYDLQPFCSSTAAKSGTMGSLQMVEDQTYLRVGEKQEGVIIFCEITRSHSTKIPATTLSRFISFSSDPVFTRPQLSKPHISQHNFTLNRLKRKLRRWVDRVAGGERQ
jgi:hypothetical protein